MTWDWNDESFTEAPRPSRRRVLTLGVLAAAGLAFPSEAKATSLSSTASPFPSVHGQVEAFARVGDLLYIGGFFDYVLSANRKVKTPARNLAVIRLTDQRVTGLSAPARVWALTAHGSTVFYGGQGFLHTLTSGSNKPGRFMADSPFEFRTVTTDGARVIANPGGALRGYDMTGRTLWTRYPSVRQGGFLCSGIFAGCWYVGGTFSVYDGRPHQGIIRIDPTTGKADPTFDAKLRPNTWDGTERGNHDGYNVSSLAYEPAHKRLILGISGTSNKVRFVNPATGAYCWQYDSVGDCQALAVVGSRVIHGCHSNYRCAAAGYRMTASWPLVKGSRGPFDLGLSQTTLESINVDAGGVRALHAYNGFVYYGGAFTGYGNRDGSVYGLTDVHRQRGLLKVKVTA